MTAIRFWLCNSGNGGPKLHCGNVVNKIVLLQYKGPEYHSKGYHRISPSASLHYCVDVRENHSMQRPQVSMWNSALCQKGSSCKQMVHTVIKFWISMTLRLLLARQSIRISKTKDKHAVVCMEDNKRSHLLHLQLRYNNSKLPTTSNRFFFSSHFDYIRWYLQVTFAPMKLICIRILIHTESFKSFN